MTTTAQWGPFSGPADAAKRLGAFVDAHLGPEVGIAWAALGGVTPLRRPHFDAAGAGVAVAVQWCAAPPPPPRPQGVWQNLKALATAAVEFSGENRLAELKSAMMQGAQVKAALDRAFAPEHRSDALGVGLDVLAVAVTLAVGLTGVGAVAEIAFWGGVALLAMDGTAYSMEVAGYDDVADETKKVTEPLRIVATIATLPDALWGGYKIIKELPEIRILKAGSLRTAARAQADATRVAGSVTKEAEALRLARAQKYAAIGERANQRAAAYGAKLRSRWALEISPRATLTPASVYLLVDDEIHTKDPGVVAAFLRQYMFHVTAVTKA